MKRLLLVVEPREPVDGRSTGMYRVRLESEDGEILLESARTPFFSGARELLRRGFDASTVIEARHKGQSIVALRSTIGEAGKLTVVETGKTGPIIQRWKPFPVERIRGRAADE